LKRLLLILILVITSSVPLVAAATTSNVYDIEVVVFENQLPNLESGELWRNEPDKSANSDIAEAVKADEINSPDSALAAAATALEKSGRHHVLAHLRWQQSAEAKSASQPVKISSADGRLIGALRFYLSRYLLVDLNLALQEATTTGVLPGTAPGTAKETPPLYRLSEYRRVKLLETHYFDHPKFGALVRVSPIKTN
jgi:hypothetical protein